MTNQQKSWLYTIAVAVVGIAVTIGVAAAVQNTTHRHDKERFEGLADLLELEIHKRAEQYEVGLRNFEGLFQASRSVEHSEFQLMSSTIRVYDSYPGSLGVGFIQMVPDDPAALEKFRDKLLSEGAPEFQVHKVPTTKDVPSEYKLNQHLLVRFIEPYERNRESLGLDIGTERARREAAELAYFTRQGVISRPLKLVQAEVNEVGFLYLLPIFRLPSRHATPAEHDEFLGWVYMPIVASHALAAVENRVAHQLAFQVRESQGEVLYTSPGFESNPVYSNSRNVAIGSRTWQVDLQPSAQFAYANHSLESWILLAGLFCSFGVAWVVKQLSSQATRAEELARTMTKDLDRLALVAKRTTNTVVIADEGGYVVWVNEAFTKLTGYEPEEILGKKPGRVLQCDETDPATVAEIRECLTAGKGFSGEIYNRSKNGRGYWVYTDIQPMHNEQGEHIGFLAIENDVTERKVAAKLLEQETQRTTLALDNGRLAIWDWNAQTDELVLDERWGTIIGPFDAEQGRFNKYWVERLHPDDVEGYEKLVASTATQDQIEGEWRYRNSQGDYVWVLVRGHVVSRDEALQPVVLTGTIMEITERKKAEEALRKSEARSKAMFERSNEAIFLFNKSGFVECNPKTLELFGFKSRDEALNYHPAEMSPPVQLDGTTAEEAAELKLTEVLANGFARFDWLHQKMTGELFESEVSLALIDAEEPLAMGILRDVSERKELERQLSQAQKLESIGQLAAGVAHEINTPMQCVFSNIEYLQDAFDRVFNLTEAYRQLDREGWSEETRAAIESIEKRSKFDRVKGNIAEAAVESGEAARRVIEIVRAMKTMSHPGTADKVSTNLNKLVEDASVISRNRWKYVAQLDRDLDTDLHEIPLLPAQMSQVMLNLIVNAADAIAEKLGDEPSELGQINVRTKVVDGGVVIQVEDTGNGMPEHVRKRIFDPFYTTKEVGKGTGQGLAIAYDVIVNQHQGRIDVDSVPGEGTTFSLWLPCPEMAALPS